MNRLTVCLAVLSIVAADSVPNHFPKCKKDDSKLSECLTNSANQGWPEFVKNNKFDDIPIENKTIVVTTIFTGKIHRGHFLGFDNIKFEDINVDLKKKSVDLVYTQPKMVVHIYDYDIEVDFVGLKLEDKIEGNATFTDGFWKYSFNYDLVEHDGKEYMQLKNPKLSYNVQKLSFLVDSKTDHERGLQIQNVFNNFWRLFNIFGEVPIAELISNSVTPYIDNFLKSVPMKSLFA